MTTGSTYLQQYGQGHPMVLVHGFGLDPSIWDLIISPLAKSYRVIVVGLPGLSRTPFQRLPSMEAASDWLNEQLKALEVGPFVLVGHSMGGYIGLSYLARYAHQLQGLCLVHSHVYADTETKQDERKKAATFVRKNGTAAWAKVAVPPLFSVGYQQTHEQQIVAMIEKYSQFDPEVIAQYLLAMADRNDHQSTLRHANVPIGIIMGAHDQHAPLDKNLAQSTLPNTADVHLLESTAHMGMIEEPDGMVQGLKSVMEFCFTPAEQL